MTGLDVSISYEDGLRLSELYGQLAEAQSTMTHLWTEAAPAIIGAAVVILLSGLFITMLVSDTDNDVKGARRFRIGMLTTFMLIAVSAVAIYEGIRLGVVDDIASYHAQIDAILAKYSGVWT